MKPRSSRLIAFLAAATHAAGAVTRFNATVRIVQQALMSEPTLDDPPQKFDDIATMPLTSLIGVGNYDGVDYNAFSILGNQLVGGVASESPPNRTINSAPAGSRIVTDSQQQATNGTPSLTPVKPYVYLELEDFSFGCALHTDESVASAAIQCTITVAGFAKGSDEEVALASFTFTPPSVAAAPVPMEHAVLPVTFLARNIVNVTIVQDDPLTQALLIDTVHGSLSTS